MKDRTIEYRFFLKMKAKQYIIAIAIALIYVVLYNLDIMSNRFAVRDILISLVLGLGLYKAVEMIITKKRTYWPLVFNNKSLANWTAIVLISLFIAILYKKYFGA